MLKVVQLRSNEVTGGRLKSYEVYKGHMSSAQVTLDQLRSQEDG